MTGKPWQSAQWQEHQSARFDIQDLEKKKKKKKNNLVPLVCRGFYHYPEKCVWLSQCVYRFLVLQLCCWVKCWGQCRMDGWMDGGLGVLLILIFLSFWGPVAWIRYLGTDLMHRRNICISRVLILTFFRACDVEVASALSPHTLIALRSRLCLVFIVSDWLFPGTALTWQHGENTTVCLPTDSITVLLLLYIEYLSGLCWIWGQHDSMCSL